ncbi:MAG: SH3 domain-containing protein [Campylobacterota bacterium]|nr:SH3 domain-containing protein [Campylobacterota bacterium]
MKIFMAVIFLSLLLYGEDSSLLTRAVTKLIDENRKIEREVQTLREEVHKLKIEQQKSLQKQEDLQEKKIILLQQQIDDLKKSKNSSLKPLKALKPFSSSKYYVVSIRDLNVRLGPGLNYRVVAKLKSAEEVVVTNKIYPNWYQISKDDQVGWVYSKWLRVKNK